MNLSLKVSTASLRSLFLSLILLLCGIGILSPAQAMNLTSNESAADDSKPAIGSQAQATNAKLELLIPFYIHPSDKVSWQKIVDASSQVPITVIINPASGPGSGDSDIRYDSNYHNGINTLRRNGVKVLGYVHTKKDFQSNPEILRNLDDIKDDVDKYTDPTNNFQLDGIFFDEVTSSSENYHPDHLDEYERLYNYVKSKSNRYLVVLNPGTNLDENYLNVGNAAIIFEAPGNPNHRYYRDWLTYKPDPYVSNYPSERFAFLEYDVRDADTMRDHILEALKRNIKYVYVTHDSGSDPWDSLPSYWQDEVDYIEQLNNGTSPEPLTCMGHVVTIRGTEGPDTIHGTSGRDVIHGLGGNDTIYGNGGDDIICAGNGGDFVNGNQGNDQIDGGEGWDTLRGGKNDDTINGGPGNDKIYGDLGRDTINGNQGNDSIYGGAGNDTLRGGQNNDFINGNQGNDQVYGDKGNDTLHGGKNNDTINGGNGTDRIYGDRGVDRCSNGPHIFGCER